MSRAGVDPDAISTTGAPTIFSPAYGSELPNEGDARGAEGFGGGA